MPLAQNRSDAEVENKLKIKCRRFSLPVGANFSTSVAVKIKLKRRKKRRNKRAEKLECRRVRKTKPEKINHPFSPVRKFFLITAIEEGGD